MKCFDVGMKDGSMGRMCGDENGMKTKKKYTRVSIHILQKNVGGWVSKALNIYCEY